MEEHGDVVVGERHVVAVGAPDAAVVGNKDKEGMVKPRLLCGLLHEPSDGPVGVFNHALRHLFSVGLEFDILGYDIGCVVAAGLWSGSPQVPTLSPSGKECCPITLSKALAYRNPRILS